jgi:hypothetical protein
MKNLILVISLFLCSCSGTVFNVSRNLNSAAGNFVTQNYNSIITRGLDVSDDFRSCMNNTEETLTSIILRGLKQSEYRWSNCGIKVQPKFEYIWAEYWATKILEEFYDFHMYCSVIASNTSDIELLNRAEEIKKAHLYKILSSTLAHWEPRVSCYDYCGCSMENKFK